LLISPEGTLNRVMRQSAREFNAQWQRPFRILIRSSQCYQLP
jgi:hypothetical protein